MPLLPVHARIRRYLMYLKTPNTHVHFVGISENIKTGKAVGVEMCGEKLVLFRGKDGKVSGMFVCCPHVLSTVYFLAFASLFIR